MTSYHELDKMPTRELHDRAMAHAKRHLDVKFMWELLEVIPAAQSLGSLDQAEQDVTHPAKLVEGAVASDPALMQALRPVYLDYLSKL